MANNLEKSKDQISWHAPEFNYVHKEVEWYWMTIIVASVVFLISIWQRNLLFAFFIVIAEFLILHWGRQFPKTLKFSLTKNSVRIGNIDEYPYSHIAGFSILRHDDHSEIVFQTKKSLQPYLKILIDSDHIKEIRAFLAEHLPEIDHDEPLSDHFGRMMGF